MTGTAVQMYIMRNSFESMSDVLERISVAGFDAVEFAYRVFDADPTAVSRTLEETGLAVAGGHVLPLHVDDAFDDIVERYQQLGCDTVVISHFDESRLSSRAAVRDTAAYLEEQSSRFADHGFTVCYHTDGREFVDIGGTTAFEELSRSTTDVRFQLDVGHAVEFGHDPTALMERFEERIDSVHIRDIAPNVGHSISLGRGDIDIDRCVQAAIDIDVDWIMYEGDPLIDTLSEACQRIMPQDNHARDNSQ